MTKVGNIRIFAAEQNTLHYPGRRDDMASEKAELIFVFENPNTFTEVEQVLKKTVLEKLLHSVKMKSSSDGVTE